MSEVSDLAGRPSGRLTLKDIADRAGVSKSTVSLVLRGSPLVRSETRERIRAMIAELGYVYNRGAASLRSQRTHTIGLVVNDVTNSFYAEFTAALDAFVERDGWVTLFGNSAESPERQQKIIDRMREQGVEGIILCPARGTSPDLIEALRAGGLPCVQSTRHVTGREADYVGQDNVLGMEMATEHLIRLGHRCIAFIGGAPWNSSAVDRENGYRNALLRHGLAFDPALVFRCETRQEAAARAIAAALAASPQPTAAVCMNDLVAFGALRGLSDQGLRPGVDFAVVGFDNRRDTAFWRPSLSTVSISPEAVAVAAASLLLRRIADPNGGSEWVILPPERLVVRESCGAPLMAGEERRTA